MAHSQIHIPGYQEKTNVAPPPPPPFLWTFSEVGKRALSSVPANKPPKGSMLQFVGFLKFFLIIFVLYPYIQENNTYNMCIYINLLIPGATSGSAEQPPLAPNGKALNQPKPHPSNRLV